MYANSGMNERELINDKINIIYYESSVNAGKVH